MGGGERAQRGQRRQIRPAHRREPRVHAHGDRLARRRGGALARREGKDAPSSRRGERRQGHGRLTVEAHEGQVQGEDGVLRGVLEARGAGAPVQAAGDPKDAALQGMRRRGRRKDSARLGRRQRVHTVHAGEGVHRVVRNGDCAVRQVEGTDRAGVPAAVAIREVIEVQTRRHLAY